MWVAIYSLAPVNVSITNEDRKPGMGGLGRVWGVPRADLAWCLFFGHLGDMVHCRLPENGIPRQRIGPLPTRRCRAQDLT